MRSTKKSRSTTFAANELENVTATKKRAVFTRTMYDSVHRSLFGSVVVSMTVRIPGHAHQAGDRLKYEVSNLLLCCLDTSNCGGLLCVLWASEGRS